MANLVTNEMLKAAMKKGIETGLIPRHSHLNGYLKSWESLGLVIQAALEAAPKNR